MSSGIRPNELKLFRSGPQDSKTFSKYVILSNQSEKQSLWTIFGVLGPYLRLKKPLSV